VGILDRFKRRRAGGSAGRGPDAVDAEHLRAWAVQHHGVEAYVEPSTPMSGLTVVYDVQKVGYPQRMRDHDARARILRDRERERP
jgi:hypothetical protein